jgi:Ca-activated chloride channel family protein
MESLQIVDNSTEVETAQVFTDWAMDSGFSEGASAENIDTNTKVITREDIKAAGKGSIVRALHNLDPTFYYVAENNVMGSTPVLTMRGNTSLALLSEPSHEEYNRTVENRFVSVKKSPLSTFSLEADGASYSNARRMLNSGRMPDPASVRVEEFINYFSYDYPAPTGSDPLRIGYEVGDSPWNPHHKLVSVSVKAREIPSANLPKTNFVFLVDVSGSMFSDNKLPLVKSSLKLLVNNLREGDRVAIVAYAGAAGEVLPSTSGGDKQKIREALDALQAGGSTAGGAGLQLAYKIARQNFVEGGNNRVIMCTDGDFNVGVSSNEGLEELIERERKSGVFLTLLGYGMGNYKDSKLQTLAEKGNGNHAYIDNLQEANKVLVGEFGSTMYAVAKDVKLQVEFNPAAVRSYRLVGYESRLLADEDFNDDTKDAGEIGAGHTVTAFYEVVPVDSPSRAGTVDELKYQPVENSRATPSGELMTVKLRYKEPAGSQSKLMSVAVTERAGATSDDFRFASAVAMLGQLLSGSDFNGEATYDKAIERARTALGDDPNGYRREFIRLAEVARGVTK